MGRLPAYYDLEKFPKELHTLPGPVREALRKFLETLVDNPDLSTWEEKYECSWRGHFSHEFFPGYVMYWKCKIADNPAGRVTLGSFPPVIIRVLMVRSL